jgi:hypothetical protein
VKRIESDTVPDNISLNEVDLYPVPFEYFETDILVSSCRKKFVGVVHWIDSSEDGLVRSWVHPLDEDIVGVISVDGIR